MPPRCSNNQLVFTKISLNILNQQSLFLCQRLMYVLERDFNAPSMHFATLKLPSLLAFAKTQYQAEMNRAFSDLLLVSSSTHVHSILDPQEYAGDFQAHDGYLLLHIFFLRFCPASYLPQLVLLPQATTKLNNCC